MWEVLRIARGLILRAGWAPIGLFILHVCISRIFNGYLLFPSIDIPMHFLGGVAMAYFFLRCFAAVPEQLITPEIRKPVEFLVVASLTATATIFWEFAEFISDILFGTHSQLGFGDTMLDVALGLLGGVCYLLVALRQGSMGEVSSLEAASSKKFL